MTARKPLEVMVLKTNGTSEFMTIAEAALDDELHRLVGGYLELVPLAERMHGMIALANEEGMLQQLPPNPWSYSLLAPPRLEYAPQRRLLVGDVVLLREDGDEFVTLSAEDKVFLQRFLRFIEHLKARLRGGNT